MAKKKKISISAIADKLTKEMGKYEKMIDKGDPLSKKTAKLMMKKTQEKLDKVFNEQERMKKAEFETASNKFLKKYGGYLGFQGDNFRYGGNPGGPEGGEDDTIPYPTYKSAVYTGDYNQPLQPGLGHGTDDATIPLFAGGTSTERLSPEEYAKRVSSNMNPMGYKEFINSITPTEGAMPSITPMARRFNYGGKTPNYQEGGNPDYDKWLAEQPEWYKAQNSPEQLQGDFQRHLKSVGPSEYEQKFGEFPTTETVQNRFNPKMGTSVASEPVITGNQPPAAPNYTSNPTATQGIEGELGMNQPTQEQGFDFGNALYKGAAYAPTIYNAMMGLKKPQILDAESFQNPYEQGARDLMADRRYNVDPQIAANARSFNATRKSIGSASQGSAAQFLGNIGTAQSRQDASNAQAYGTKQNMDNQYMAQQAQMDAQLGNIRAGRELQIQDINDRNRAARNAYMGQAVTGLSGIAQNERRMNNLSSADASRIEALKGMGMYFDPQFDQQRRNHQLKGYGFKGQ